jgi:hypothetical protein
MTKMSKFDKNLLLEPFTWGRKANKLNNFDQLSSECKMKPNDFKPEVRLIGITKVL